MTGDKSEAEIQSRFVAEQEYIQRFLHFLRVKGSLRDEQIREVSNVLRQNGLPELPARGDWRRSHDPYLPEETAALVAVIESIRPALELAVTEAHAHLSMLEAPRGLRAIDVRSTLGEWIQYFVEALGGHVTQAAIEQAVDDAKQMQAQAVREHGDDYIEVLSDEEIQYAIDSALFLLADRKLAGLLYVQDRFLEFDLAHRLASPDAGLNVLRQGFLLLMTAFDAAVFDLFRVGLSRDFFKGIAALAGKDKVPFARFSKFQTFEQFRDDIIEDQLRSRYLKDLLQILNSFGVECVDEATGDRFIDLIELVLRRNVHVHNRGIVDERYLERDENGSPRFNIHNLQLGTLAVIDFAYWERANRLCRNCVQRVATWAGGHVS